MAYKQWWFYPYVFNPDSAYLFFIPNSLARLSIPSWIEVTTVSFFCFFLDFGRKVSTKLLLSMMSKNYL